MTSYNLRGAIMKRISVTNKVIDEIKADILSGEYKEGEKYLSENELCQKFGASRTTIRESIKTLQAIGFLELKPGRGAFVAACDERMLNNKAIDKIFSNEDDYLELSEVRLGVEPTMAKYAAKRASEDEVLMLYGILAVFEKAYKAKDMVKLIETDEKFHNQLALSAHNEVYIKLYKQLSESVRGCRTSLFSVENNGESAILEHIEIVDAISEHDEQKAYSAMEKHIKNVYENIKTIANKKG